MLASKLPHDLPAGAVVVGAPADPDEYARSLYRLTLRRLFRLRCTVPTTRSVTRAGTFGMPKQSARSLEKWPIGAAKSGSSRLARCAARSFAASR